MSVPHFFTGSEGAVDDKPSIIFLEGKLANQVHGVPIRKNDGPCPHCGAAIDCILAFNFSDSYYYLNCPVCNYWFRYCSFDGNLADLKVVKSTKVTKVDEELDDFITYTGTF